MYLPIQRLLPILGHVGVLLGLLSAGQCCRAGVCRPHYSLALQVAPLVFQIHLQCPSRYFIDVAHYAALMSLKISTSIIGNPVCTDI